MTAREQIWALLPRDAPGAQGWTSRSLCNVTGLPWGNVSAAINNLHREKLIRIVGGSRGHGYLWVRTCESLPPDRRGHHDHHPAGPEHYQRRLRGRAARAPALRKPSNAHAPVALPPASLLDAWPRLTRLPGKK